MHSERQKEIIQASYDLIAESGIQGLTIKNLAKRIGVTEPAIYRHFESKIQILVALLDLLKKNSTDIFNSGLTTDSTSLQKVEQLFEKHFKSFAEMPSLASVVFSEEIFRNEETLTAKITEVIEHNSQTLMTIIENGQQRNEIRTDIEAGHLVIVIMGSLRLFVKKWQIAKFTFDLQKEGAKLIQSVKFLISNT